ALVALSPAYLQQVCRLVQPADEVQPHGRRARRRFGAGMGHARRLLRESVKRQKRQNADGKKSSHGHTPFFSEGSAYLLGGKEVETPSAMAALIAARSGR